jgi:hypothetical protein
MRLSDAGVRCRPTKLIYPNHRFPPWPTEDPAPRSLEPIVRGRRRATVKSTYDKPAYTQTPNVMLHRYMPLAKASPSHVGLPSGRHGIRGFNTRNGQIKTAATLNRPMNSNKTPMAIDNAKISPPSASEAATLRRCVIGPLTMRLSDAGLHQRQTKALDPNHRPPPWPTEDVASRSLEPEVRR